MSEHRIEPTLLLFLETCAAYMHHTGTEEIASWKDLDLIWNRVLEQLCMKRGHMLLKCRSSTMSQVATSEWIPSEFLHEEPSVQKNAARLLWDALLGPNASIRDFRQRLADAKKRRIELLTSRIDHPSSP
jgi:hypothetical protein